MTSRFRFAELVAETEATLVHGLRLRPVVIEPALARADGTWKGERVTLETRAYTSGTIRYARFAQLVGADLEIGNILGVPDPLYALPILGADLVALGRATGMIAADLSPTLPPGPEREQQLAPLAARRAASAALPSGGELPAWCNAWFSPHALYTRVSSEQADAAARAYAVFPEEFVELMRRATPRADRVVAVRAAQAGYATSHRTDDRGLGLLATMFGAAWADCYINTVLFPAARSTVC